MSAQQTDPRAGAGSVVGAIMSEFGLKDKSKDEDDAGTWPTAVFADFVAFSTLLPTIGARIVDPCIVHDVLAVGGRLKWAVARDCWRNDWLLNRLPAPLATVLTRVSPFQRAFVHLFLLIVLFSWDFRSMCITDSCATRRNRDSRRVVVVMPEPSPLLMIEKSTVIQECRVFHDAKFVKNHPKRCCQMITKLLYLLTQGETLQGTEASEVFFGVTKLFQSTDVR